VIWSWENICLHLEYVYVVYEMETMFVSFLPVFLVCGSLHALSSLY